MSFGFIITRHVNSRQTNQYWKESYRCIRKFYPTEKIVIIDDNSDPEYLTTDDTMTDTTIIESEYKGRGELLPYYYYAKCGWFENALILHDSVFIHKKVELKIDNGAYKMLWTFPHFYNQPDDERRLLWNLNHANEILSFHSDKNKWGGCFGAMSMISHDFISSIDKKYDLSKLLETITTRYNRCSFERVIACLMSYHYIEYKREYPTYVILFGNIFRYNWGYTYDQYLADLQSNNINIPFVKVWTGR